MQTKRTVNSAFFITFSGNCKKALTVYHDCFGGELYFDTFNQPIAGIEESPVVSGFLVSEKVTVYGSDLVHNEGRRIGNHLAFYVHCHNPKERLSYLQKLNNRPQDQPPKKYPKQKLIEMVDAFEVRWIFGV